MRTPVLHLTVHAAASGRDVPTEVLDGVREQDALRRGNSPGLCFELHPDDSGAALRVPDIAAARRLATEDAAD